MDVVTMEQRRAKFAYERVREVKGSDKETLEKYNSYVKSAPVLILTNGLGQTLAFYLSKLEKLSESTEGTNHKRITPEDEPSGEKRAYAYLYKHISEWLAQTVTNGQDPLVYYTRSNNLETIRMTEEAIAFLNWLKRFAEAMLKKEKTEGGS